MMFFKFQEKTERHDLQKPPGEQNWSRNEINIKKNILNINNMLPTMEQST